MDTCSFLSIVGGHCGHNRRYRKPAQIADLLNFVLSSTYLQYNGSIDEHQERAALENKLFSRIKTNMVSYFLFSTKHWTKKSILCLW